MYISVFFYLFLYYAYTIMSAPVQPYWICSFECVNQGGPRKLFAGFLRLIKLHPGINSQVCKEMTEQNRIGAKEKIQRARKMEKAITTRAAAQNIVVTIDK